MKETLRMKLFLMQRLVNSLYMSKLFKNFILIVAQIGRSRVRLSSQKHSKMSPCHRLHIINLRIKTNKMFTQNYDTML